MSKVLRSQVNGTDEISFSKLIDFFLKRWYLIPLFFFFSLVAAKLFLRYTRPVYQANATIKIEEDNSAINQLGIYDFGSFGSNIASEIQVIQSSNIVRKALEKINYQVSYYFVGNLLTTEVYDDSPFKVLYEETEDNNIRYETNFTLVYKGSNKFEISQIAGDQELISEHYFGEEVVLSGFKFRVIKVNENKHKLQEGNVYKWKVNNMSGLVSRAKRGLKIEQKGFMVSILSVTYEDQVPGFASDFVNALCEVYREEDKNIKTRAASQALDFIEEQLDTIELKVRESELALEDYMKKNYIISSSQNGASIGTEKLRELETSRAELELKQQAVNRLEKEVTTEDKTLSPFPFSLFGSTDALLNSLVSSYNELLFERMQAKQKFTETSPKILEYTNRLDEIRQAIKDNIGSIKANLGESISFYDRKIDVEKESLKGIPEQNRVIATLQREFKVNESVFNTLLEKRAESSIAKASIVSSVRVVDPSKRPTIPISPNSSKIYIIAMGVGGSLGFVVILIMGLLKNTISYRTEIESISLAPVIGEVRRSNSNLGNKFPNLVIHHQPKSALSESIRVIRTNLQFISAEKQSKMISITSTVSGEGKSFITINLAGMISLLNKKVVVIDLDLRKPKLHYSFGLENSSGLSTYLVGKDKLDDIKYPTDFENLDIIPSGPIPPNPAELLQSMKMELLLMELRKTYDYIIIDTPPIGLVTDGMPMLRNSDIVLYVLRADYSRRAYATIPDKLVEEQRLKNVYILFNSVSSSGGGYGRYGSYGSYGSYGVYGNTSSGYYVEESTTDNPWWRFWKKS